MEQNRDIEIDPGVIEEVLKHALSQVRETNLTDEAYRCWVCNVPTRNGDSGFTCPSCREKNASIEPFEIVRRFMLWRTGAPEDLLQVIIHASGLTGEEIVTGIYAGEISRDQLAQWWDEETRYCVASVGTRHEKKYDDRNRVDPYSFNRLFVEIPEEQRTYKSRFRPLTPSERKAEKERLQELQKEDQRRVEQARVENLRKQAQIAQKALETAVNK